MENFESCKPGDMISWISEGYGSFTIHTDTIITKNNEGILTNKNGFLSYAFLKLRQGFLEKEE